MEFIRQIIEKTITNINGIESENELFIRLGIGLALFILLVIFRNKISKLIVFISTKTIARKSKVAQNAMIDSLTKPIAVLVGALGFYSATEIVAPSGEIRSFAVKVLKLFLIFVVAWSAVSFINSDYSIFMKNDDSKTKKTALAFISNLIKVIIILIALLLVLEQFGISATRIFATLGIGGVAIAFACKDAVENMISGFIIIFGKPFEVDDCINIDGQFCTIDDIKIRTTRLKMIDGSEKIYPNTTMVNSPILNYSRMEKRAFEETLWFNYSYSGDEINKICQDLREIILGYDSVLKDDVRVNFLSFGEHALEVTLFFYVTETATPQYQELKNKINIDIKNYVNDNNIEMSFDSQTVYFGNELSLKNK